MSGGGGASDKKRDDFPGKHRDTAGSYSSSSRSRDDTRLNKRDDYDSPKRDRRDHSGNVDYKRDTGYIKRSDIHDLPPRHSSSTSVGGVSYAMGGSHGRSAVVNNNDEMIIMKPYIDQGGRGSGPNDFRRNNMNNVTLVGGNPNSGGSAMSPMLIKDERPRYIDNGSQNEVRYGGGNDRGGMWENNSGPVSVKPFATQIQNDDWSQDRYDRTYNERKSPYMEPVRQSSGTSVTFMNRPQDRYNSRFDSGRI